MGNNDREAPARKRKTKAKANGKVVWQGFIEVTLTADAIAELEAMDCAQEFPYEDVEGLVREGYKVTFAADQATGGRRVTLTDNDPDSPMAGFAVSGWAVTTRDAYSSVMYKHRYLMTDGWGEYNSTIKSPKYA